MPATLAASILSADMARLLDQVRLVERYADSLHIDLMDGHFVSTLGIGPGVVESLRPHTDLRFHCHLMLEDPLALLDVLAKAGTNLVTCHLEAVEDDPAAAIAEVRARGMDAGLAINPETPAAVLLPYLEQVVGVIVMSVHPGWAGQAFLPEVLPKVEALRAEIDRRGLTVDIEMDGGINAETGRRCLEAGATVLAAASSIFRSEDPAASARTLADLVRSVP